MACAGAASANRTDSVHCCRRVAQRTAVPSAGGVGRVRRRVLSRRTGVEDRAGEGGGGLFFPRRA
eukprot:5224861-Pyramimonas_sp.AAC.1